MASQVVFTQELCPICSENRTDTGINTTSTLCGHVFCNPCLKKWTKRSNDCPICRSDMRTKQEIAEEIAEALSTIVDEHDEDNVSQDGDNSSLNSTLDDVRNHTNSVDYHSYFESMQDFTHNDLCTVILDILRYKVNPRARVITANVENTCLEAATHAINRDNESHLMEDEDIDVVDLRRCLQGVRRDLFEDFNNVSEDEMIIDE